MGSIPTWNEVFPDNPPGLEFLPKSLLSFSKNCEGPGEGRFLLLYTANFTWLRSLNITYIHFLSTE
jgi:hypothetical protein